MHGAILNYFWPRRRPPRGVHWLTALGMAIAAATLALAAAILLHARADARTRAAAASSTLAVALSREISRDIAVCDRMVRTAIGQTGTAMVDSVIDPAILVDQARNGDDACSIVVLDENGDIVAGSTSVAPRRLNVSGQDHFRVHHAEADTGLFVSHPLPGPASSGNSGIAISRRISHADGGFAGVVVATFRPASLLDPLGGRAMVSPGSVTLFRTDGQVIMRHPHQDSAPGSDLAEAQRFQKYREHAAYGETVTVEGTQLYDTFRRLPGLPLVLVASVALDGIDAAWRREAAGTGAALISLSGLMMILSLLFRREIRLRLDVEDRLRDAAERMTVIATTDALTGLANRRAFEERLGQEWLRAIRGRTAIALLMLDADFFKLFNDQYGHPGGDMVLRSIAGCIAGNVLRPADIGARHGGEEFAVLLPETEFQGAMIVAERIRIAVASLGIGHTAHPEGRVTVSIGVAVAYPTAADAPSALVGLADEALYQAKHAGRNRVSGMGFHHMMPPRPRHRDKSLGSDDVDVVLQ